MGAKLGLSSRGTGIG